jgi:hypothetical protein
VLIGQDMADPIWLTIWRSFDLLEKHELGIKYVALRPELRYDSTELTILIRKGNILLKPIPNCCLINLVT